MSRHLLSEEVRASAVEARQANIASTRNTNRPGSEETDLQIGDKVRVQRSRPAAGTWKRYAGKVGTVVTINRPAADDHGTRGDYVEIGVHFGQVNAANLKQVEATAWFRDDELTVRALRQAETAANAA